MNLLGLETSAAIGSVALATKTGVLVRTIASTREQTDQLLKSTDELLAEAGLELADLAGIAFGRGPGSFTGLRVSAAVVQGLSAVSGVPVLPVSSLLCIAERARREHGCERALVCVDAHMGEVYWAEVECRAGVVAVVGAERLSQPQDVAAPQGSGWWGVGNGFANHAAALATVAKAAARVLPDLLPGALDLFPQARRDLEAGKGVAAHAALPVYLRGETAWKRTS
jgi:tRNA threonylcarbamoyladenosine biosynthesis protein TsaB